MKIFKVMSIALILSLFFVASPLRAEQDAAPQGQDDSGRNVYDTGDLRDGSGDIDGSLDESARPWLGVVIQEVTLDKAQTMGLGEARGVFISDVTHGSPAEHAGISAGDVILRLNGNDVKGVVDFVSGIQSLRPGNAVILEVDRKGNIEKVDVMLTSTPGGGAMAGHHYRMHGRGDYQMRADKTCQACCQEDGCPDMGAVHGMMPGRHGDMTGMEKYGKMYLMAIKALNLTEDQQKKARSIKADYQKKTIKLMADIKIAEVELGELLASEAVNIDKVKAKISDIGAKGSELRFFRVKSLIEFKKMLNEEQRKKMNELMPMGGMAGAGYSDMTNDPMTGEPAGE